MFWSTQPVKNNNENLNEEVLDIENIVLKDNKLPEFFEWVELNLDDFNLFLKNNYNDPNDKIRFNYSTELIKHNLLVPNYINELFIGITYKNKLVASICGVPIDMIIFDKKLKMIEINYLCIHYKLRNKNLSPILISEITRRAFKNNIRYAFYAGGNLYPNSIVKTSYFDRLLNINKFVDIGYLGETNTLNLNKLKKRFEVNKVQNLNLLELKEEDCLHVCNKLNEYLNKLKIKVHFELDDFKHKFLPKENLIYSFITKDYKDFISFYYLESSVSHDIHKEIKKVYLSYYFSDNIVNLMDNCIYKLKDMDSISCLNIMDNKEFIKKCDFLETASDIYYYFYNWNCPIINTNDMGIVLF